MKLRDVNIFLITAFCILCLYSCAAPTVKTNFTTGNYTLKAGNPPSTPLPVYIKYLGCTLNDKPLADNTQRSQEIHRGMQDLSKLLDNSRLFKSVETGESKNADIEGADFFFLVVSFSEEEDTHTAGTVGKAFASGFFTLGLAPVTYKYTYSSKMDVKVLRLNREVLATSAIKQAEASSSQMAMESNRSLPERTITRKFITQENNNTIVDFLVKHSGTLYKK